MAENQEEKKALTKAQKMETTRGLVRELLAIKPMMKDELMQEAARLYLERYPEEGETKDGVRSRVGRSLQEMEEKSEIMRDEGGMYALKSRLPQPPKKKKTVPAPDEKERKESAEVPAKKLPKNKAKKAAPEAIDTETSVAGVEPNAETPTETPAKAAPTKKATKKTAKKTETVAKEEEKETPAKGKFTKEEAPVAEKKQPAAETKKPAVKKAPKVKKGETGKQTATPEAEAPALETPAPAPVKAAEVAEAPQAQPAEEKKKPVAKKAPKAKKADKAEPVAAPEKETLKPVAEQAPDAVAPVEEKTEKAATDKLAEKGEEKTEKTAPVPPVSPVAEEPKGSVEASAPKAAPVEQAAPAEKTAPVEAPKAETQLTVKPKGEIVEKEVMDLTSLFLGNANKSSPKKEAPVKTEPSTKGTEQTEGKAPATQTDKPAAARQSSQQAPQTPATQTENKPVEQRTDKGDEAQKKGKQEPVKQASAQPKQGGEKPVSQQPSQQTAKKPNAQQNQSVSASKQTKAPQNQPKANQNGQDNQAAKSTRNSRGRGNGVKSKAPLTPDEQLKELFLDRLWSLGGDYFEYYSVYLLMRYNLQNRCRLEGLRICGGDQDGGIDGVLELTARGFRETIYIQSKNWAPDKGDKKKWVIGETLVREFLGACIYRQTTDRLSNARGVFITTSRFTPEARRMLDEMADKIVGYDQNEVFEMAKKCEFGLIERDGAWTLDEELLSGMDAFYNL